MKFRQKPNGMWVVDYDDGGTRRRVSTGIKSAPQKTAPAEAKAAAREIVLGIRTPIKFAQQAQKRDGRMNMSELFDKAEMTVWHPDNVRSQSTIRSNLKVLRSFIGDVPIEDMTFTRLEQLVTDMKTHGYKPGTIKRKLSMVAKALKMATMWTDDAGRPLLGYKPPLPTVVVNNLKDRTITAAEEEAIFVAVEKRRQTEPHRQWFRFRVLLRLLFDTGGRLGESLGLGPDNITSLSGTSYVTFPRYLTKSGKPRTLPLTPTVVEALGSLMDQLVLDKPTQEWRFFGFTNSFRLFQTVREDVRLETGMDLSDVTLHTIRHTTLTRLARGGMGLAQLQMWAGHSDPKITAERYLHLMPSDLVGGLAILGNTGPSGAINTAHNNSPVSVPDTLSRAKGANLGTVSLQ